MNKFEFSDKSQIITIYGYNPTTLEYVGKNECEIPAHTGIPAYATHVPPPVKGTGQAVIYDQEEGDWNLVPDYRGKPVYSTETGQCLGMVNLPGELEEGQTILEPTSPWDKWVDGKWETDNDARLKSIYASNATEQKRLINDTSKEIDILTDRVNIDRSPDPDADRELIAKLKAYRVDVYSLDINVEKVDWPVYPGGVQ